MKKILITILGVLVLLIAGCGEMTPYERQVWSGAFQNMSQIQQQNLNAQWQYSQPQIVYPQQQQNNSTYWQEQNAYQQWFDNNQIKTKPPQRGTIPRIIIP